MTWRNAGAFLLSALVMGAGLASLTSAWALFIGIALAATGIVVIVEGAGYPSLLVGWFFILVGVGHALTAFYAL